MDKFRGDRVASHPLFRGAKKRIENIIFVNIMEKIKALDRYLIINSTLWRC